MEYPPEKQQLLSHLLAQGDGHYREMLGWLAPHLNDAKSMSHVWANKTLPTFDAMAYWAMLKEFQPHRIIEVGSGRSTLISLEARKRGFIESHITVIDPGDGRNNLDLDHSFFNECESHVNAPVQTLDPDLFRGLKAGDLLFVDGSHICYRGSDVTYVFLEVLPRLNQGVIVHIHDIMWPFDYPLVWHQQRRGYTEHYLMAVMLLADAGRRYKIHLPVRYILSEPAFEKSLLPWSEAANSVGMELSGESWWSKAYMGYQGTGFWMEVNG